MDEGSRVEEEGRRKEEVEYGGRREDGGRREEEGIEKGVTLGKNRRSVIGEEGEEEG